MDLKPYIFFTTLLTFSFLSATDSPLPEEITNILKGPNYTHANFGLYAKDLNNGEVLYDIQSNKLFSPGSTTKLFSVAALLRYYGDDYRFKTPVYALGTIKNNRLEGNLVLVSVGDLTLGGRFENQDKISFTKMDHIYANAIPNVILTKEDPLYGLKELAKQVYQSGIKEIDGDVLIDTSLFPTQKVRAKTGTGVSYNLATAKFFLITQALSGYVEGKNGHLIAYMVVVENGKMDSIEDVFSYFEDEAKISNIIYDHSESKKDLEKH